MIKVNRQSNPVGLTPDLTPLLDIIFIVMVFDADRCRQT